MLRNFSKKLAGKFSCDYSMVTIARLKDAFAEIFGLEASQVEGQSLPQNDNKVRKRKGEQKLGKSKKPEDVIHILVQFSKFSFLRIPEQKCLKTRCLWNK